MASASGQPDVHEITTCTRYTRVGISKCTGIIVYESRPSRGNVASWERGKVLLLCLGGYNLNPLRRPF